MLPALLWQGAPLGLVRVVAMLLWLVQSTVAGFASEVRQDEVASAALGRPFPYLIYLPDAYKAGTPLPVVYLLHGAGANEGAWLEQGQLKRNLDELIAAKAIPPVVVVMPGCPACWWVDGPRDRAESAFWEDLLPTVERRHHLPVTRNLRFVAGLSAGGYGAVRYALKYPDKLGGVAAFSPAVYTSRVPAQSAARSQPPFLTADGQFDQQAWDEKNYPRLLDGYFAQPLRVPFYLVSGDNDRLGIAPETMKLFMAMYEKQPELAELRIVDGDHNWGVWAGAIKDSLVYLLKNVPRDDRSVALLNKSAKR